MIWSKQAAGLRKAESQVERSELTVIHEIHKLSAIFTDLYPRFANSDQKRTKRFNSKCFDSKESGRLIRVYLIQVFECLIQVDPNALSNC